MCFLLRLPDFQRPLRRIQNEWDVHLTADAPASDVAGANTDEERRVQSVHFGVNLFGLRHEFT